MKYSANKHGWTPTAVADTTAFTDGGYMAVQGGGATQRLSVSEISCNGQAAASAVNAIVAARDSTIGATSLTGALLAAIKATASPPSTVPVAFSASATKPQRSSTLQLLDLSFNAFGGVVRWTALTKDDEIELYGNTASLGELSLSCIAGVTPGAMGSHIIFEVV